jgi:hypothetical protein
VVNTWASDRAFDFICCALSYTSGVGVGGEEQKVDKIPLFNIPWLVLSIVILFVGTNVPYSVPLEFSYTHSIILLFYFT